MTVSGVTHRSYFQRDLLISTLVTFGHPETEYYTGFENPGHAGHMCPVTFEIRQPHLARPKASQIRISGLQAQPAIFLKELAWPQAQPVISVHFFFIIILLAASKQIGKF